MFPKTFWFPHVELRDWQSHGQHLQKRPLMSGGRSKTFQDIILTRCYVEENTLLIPSAEGSIACFTKGLTKLRPKKQEQILLLLLLF